MGPQQVLLLLFKRLSLSIPQKISVGAPVIPQVKPILASSVVNVKSTKTLLHRIDTNYLEVPAKGPV